MDQDGKETEEASMALFTVVSFLSCLVNSDSYGQVGASATALKYLSINPQVPFREIVDECRSIILAGGTMPSQKEIGVLFPGKEVLYYSYPHVIPDSNLVVLPIQSTKNGARMNFTFENRDSMVNLCLTKRLSLRCK